MFSNHFALFNSSKILEFCLSKFKSEYQIHLDTYSFEEIAQDEQLHDEELRPNSNSKNIELPIDDYQLIITCMWC